MNRTQLILRGFETSFLAIVLVVFASSAAATVEDCWADFFEGAQYAGKHFHIVGPVELKDLKSVKGENWDSRIGSLKVGDTATVTVYDDTNFKLTPTDMAKSPELMRSWGITEKDVKEQSELIFHPNSMIHDLSDFHFRNKARSLKLKCN